MFWKRFFFFYSWVIAGFALAAVALLVFSWMGSLFGMDVQNLLSQDGIRWIMRSSLKEVEGSFPFLSLLLLFMGGGVCYYSGFFQALKSLLMNRFITLSYKQRWSFQVSLTVCVCYGVLILWSIWSPSGNLLSVTGGWENSPLADGFALWVSIGCSLAGGIYGWLSGTFRRLTDFINSLLGGIRAVAPLFLLAVVLVHFVVLCSYVFG